MLALKENQAALKDWGEFLLRYPAEEVHRYHEVRSGVLWVWQARRTTQLPPEEEASFPGLKQIVAIHRHKMHKRSGPTSTSPVCRQSRPMPLPWRASAGAPGPSRTDCTTSGM